MKRVLKHHETLIYYDGPELFVGTDQVGCLYLCLLVETGATVQKYFCAVISSEHLEAFRAGEIDLRSIFVSPETDERFMVAIGASSEDGAIIEPVVAEGVWENWLPDSGFFMSPRPSANREITEDAMKRNRAIIHYRLNPPESRRETKIMLDNLAKGAALFQNVIRHAYRKAMQGLDRIARAAVDKEENYTLEVLGFLPGSFTLCLQSSARADLFGYANVEKALAILDEITERASNPEEALAVLSKHRGHVVSAYRSWLRFICDSKSPITYVWTAPKRETPISRSISKEQAGELYETLQQREELGEEDLSLQGVVLEADVERGTWRLRSEEYNKAHRGRSHPQLKPSLAGIIIETQRYHFDCAVRIEQDKTGRESRVLYLRSYKPLA